MDTDPSPRIRATELRIGIQLFFDRDPALFISGFQDVNKNKFFAFYFLKVHLNQFSKIKSEKEVT